MNKSAARMAPLWLIVATTVSGCDAGAIFHRTRVRTFNTPSSAQSPSPSQTSEYQQAARTDEPAHSADPSAADPEQTNSQVSQMLDRMVHAQQKYRQRQSPPVQSGQAPGREIDSASIAAKIAARRSYTVELSADDPPADEPLIQEPEPPAPSQPPAFTIEPARPPRPLLAVDDPSAKTPTTKPSLSEKPGNGHASAADGPAIRITAVADPARSPGSNSPTRVDPPVATVRSDGVHQANQAAAVDGSPAAGDAQLSELIRRLEKKIDVQPDDVGTQLKLKLLYAVLGHWQQALKENRSGQGEPTAEALAPTVVKLIQIFDDSAISSADQANQALTLVDELRRVLKASADLKVSALQLCWQVQSFGCYKPMEPGYFRPNKDRDVIVYLELDNFTSKFIEDTKVYQTLLALTIELIDADGKVVHRQHDERIEDAAQSRRRDFYIARIIGLPAVPAGEYTLKATVEDLVGNKVSQSSLKLTYAEK